MSKRGSYWVFVVLYWLCVLRLLFRGSPISVDGSGFMATFYWGNHYLQAGYGQFLNSLDIRRPFMYPYLTAASIITLLGCGLMPWIARTERRRCNLRRPMPLFLAGSGMMLCLLLSAAAILDLGVAFRYWPGPVMYYSAYSLVRSLVIMIPISLLAGVMALIRGSE